MKKVEIKINKPAPEPEKKKAKLPAVNLADIKLVKKKKPRTY